MPASEPIKMVVEEDKPAEKPKLKRGASSKANLQKKWEAGEGDEGEGKIKNCCYAIGTP